MTNQDNWKQQLSRYRKSSQRIGQLSTQIVTQPDADRHDCLVVLMHGYGAPREDLVGLAGPLLAECLQRGVRPAVAFPGGLLDLPDGGYGGSAWWPINMAALMQAAQLNRFDEMRTIVPPGIDAAREAVVEAVAELLERFDMTAASLALGGFSQGAMLAMDAATRGLPEPPRCLLLASGACICETQWRAAAARLSKTVVVQSHGGFDPVLPPQTGRFLYDVLKDDCESVELIEFDGGHQIPEEMIEASARAIASIVGQKHRGTESTESAP